MEFRFSDARTVVPPTDAVIPAGIRVRRGRLSVGAGVLPALGSPPPSKLRVVAGLRAGCWLGAPGQDEPTLGRLVHRGVTTLDQRRRVVLDRHVRAYLGVADADAFCVVVIALGTGGLLLVPTENFDRRLERVSLP